jgi:hypothetical protein
VPLLGLVDEQDWAQSRWASQRSRNALKPPHRLWGLSSTANRF